MRNPKFSLNSEFRIFGHLLLFISSIVRFFIEHIELKGLFCYNEKDLIRCVWRQLKDGKKISNQQKNR